MRDDLDEARALLPGVSLAFVAELGGSDRSVVRRVTAGERTLIVKQFHGSGEGWVRESAALSVLPANAPTPRLVMSGAAPPIVIMSDLGAGASVADALLGRDAAVAEDAVVAWARAAATLHRMTRDARPAFRAALDGRAGDWPVDESTAHSDLRESSEAITRYCAELDVVIPAGTLDEIVRIGHTLTGPSALTPADACPDNNVRVDDGLLLIDFESAQWRPIAWDIAYLTVPWPSCWCSWRIPAGVSERAIEAYQAINPYPEPSAFQRDVTTAEVGWSWISMSWFMRRALADDPPSPDPNKPMPTRRALILHRLASTRDQNVLSRSADLAGRLHDALVRRWGDTPLAYAPAFRTI